MYAIRSYYEKSINAQQAAAKQCSHTLLIRKNVSDADYAQGSVLLTQSAAKRNSLIRLTGQNVSSAVHVWKPADPARFTKDRKDINQYGKNGIFNYRRHQSGG